VVQVLSGDALLVDDGSGVERRVYLASVRAPRPGGSSALGASEQPYGRDAKEFLRKKLAGKRVQVIVEYVRSPAPADGESAPPLSRIISSLPH
jgi:staphylococcal nuclease domain-containing protein 1